MADRSARFGVELRRLRTVAGLSLTDLARSVHYSKGYLSKIETGLVRPNATLAEQCDHLLGAGGALITLAAAEPADDPGTPNREARPAQLPHDIRRFVGREPELAALYRCVTEKSGIAVIDGVAGIGKTSLAVHFGHRVASRYPDGQLYVDLRGFDPVLDPLTSFHALAQLARALGVDPAIMPESTDELAAVFRTALADRRVLLVLDNAASADQVRPLLPGSETCLVLVTSRRRLSGLVARDGARRITLSPLTSGEAMTLVARITGDDRSVAEPYAAAALARLCGCLPLAICVAAERVAAQTGASLSDLVDELADERDRLDVLTTAGDEAMSVRAAFTWSYRALPAEGQRMFRLLGLDAAADITTTQVAVAAGLPSARTRALLSTLVEAHLIEQISLDRFRMHDLLYVYAVERLYADEPPRALVLASRRLLSSYLRSRRAAFAMMGDSGSAALDALLSLKDLEDRAVPAIRA